MLPVYHTSASSPAGAPAATSPTSSRSLWRMWNQLTGLQRCAAAASLALVGACFLLLPFAQVNAANVDIPKLEDGGVLGGDSKAMVQRLQDQNKRLELLLREKERDETQQLAIAAQEEKALVAQIEQLKREQAEQRKAAVADVPRDVRLARHEPPARPAVAAPHEPPPEPARDPQPEPEPEPVDAPEPAPEPVAGGAAAPAAESKAYGPKNEQQRQIIKTFQWAWKGYKEFAWGHDELLPVSKRHSEWFHLGLTLVDALDTMVLMGLTEEFAGARDWIADGLDMDQSVDVNLFETTIRVLGGFLSTYHLTGDQLFLDKARDLGDRLLPAFHSQGGVPFSDVNLKTHSAHKPKWGPDSSTSEVTTIQLEFKYLSHLTGDPKYWDRASQVMHHVRSLPKKDGLVPIFINAQTGRFSGNTITLGARGDSYYEYLLKQWLQTGKTEDMYKNMYIEAVDGILTRLVKHSVPNKMTYIGELLNNREHPKMDHLVCFMPGTLAIGHVNGMPDSHMELAKELAQTCYEMYHQTATGLSPEIVYFNHDITKTHDLIIKPADAHNLLRPETVESLFILYRITKDPVYRTWGWNIYQAFEKHTRVATGGYSSLHNVMEVPPRFRDKMESFFLGETLKYLYLLFEDDDGVLPLDKYVLNTEAHPLPIFEPGPGLSRAQA